MPTLDGKIDSKIASRNDASRKHHMATKSLHVSRTPSLIDSSQPVTVKSCDAKGPLYKTSKDVYSQAFIESTFHTVEQENESKKIAKIQGDFISPRESKHAWVPSNSPSVYEKDKPKLGNQLEKKVPTPSQDFKPSVEGLLIVNGRKDMSPKKLNQVNSPRGGHSSRRRSNTLSRSLPYGRVDDVGDQELEDVLVGMPDTPPPEYEYAAYDSREYFNSDDELRRSVEEEQAELDRQARELEERRRYNKEKLEKLQASENRNTHTHKRSQIEQKSYEEMLKKVQNKLKAGMYGTDDVTYLNRYDKNRDGSLNYDELRLLIRTNLKVPPSQLTDKEIGDFLTALDRDRSGKLSIGEVMDFVNASDVHSFIENIEEGQPSHQMSSYETREFHDTQVPQSYDMQPVESHFDESFHHRYVAREGDHNSMEEEIRHRIETLYREEEKKVDYQQQHRTFYDTAQPHTKSSNMEGMFANTGTSDDAPGWRARGIDATIAKQLQNKLKAGMYGTNPNTYFNRYDKERNGTLSLTEFKRLVRSSLKVPPSQLSDKDIKTFFSAIDLDDTGKLNIDEMMNFVHRGTAAFQDRHRTAARKTMSANFDPKVMTNRDKKSTSFQSESGQPTYNIMGEAHTANDKEVTVPTPFTSMEMDVYLRRHKMDERERRLVMEVEEEKAARDRKAKKALVAEPGAAHLRLSQSNFLFKKRREEEAALLELEEMRRNQFKATEYQPDGADDWQYMAEAAEVERTKRLAKRSLAMHESARPPTMLTRDAGKSETAKLSRPHSVTKPDQTQLRKTLGPEEVRASLERSQRQWDKRMSETKEALRRERVATKEVARNPMAERELEYRKKAEERKLRKEEKERLLEAEKQQAEKAKWERAMSAPVPEGVRMTKAAALKVETVRTAQLLEEQQEKREKAREIARQRRAQEAGETLRPFLVPRQRAETQAMTAEREESARTKAKQAKRAMEERVQAKRPSLMERHDMLTAQDKAKASTFRKVGGALRTVYGGGDGWLAAAVKDNVLDAEEAEFLRLANPSASDFGGIEYDDNDEY